ncbi:MAG: 4Fe-4S binding protein [Hadesarchaea archaeon]|nr:4Fe-4S binding protein [Hadesarchaea archaeon]
MKQLTVISGKGGTGKTTITAAFASLAKNAIFADCDCDAPDLQLILKPEVLEKEEYIGSATAIREVDCSKCGKCREVCRFDAIDEEMRIIETKCEGCGACAFVCPEGAIEMKKRVTGTVYRSRTRFGPMIHAELRIGEEASGKLVSHVRKKAQELANDGDLIIIDGSPGIGCPVIASITGVDAVLVVAEPTVTGLYDMERVLKVAEHFGIPASVCINKHDINEEKTKEIETFCRTRGVPVLGKLPYDDVATKAMINGQTVIEYSNSELSRELKKVWEKVELFLRAGG